MTPLNGDGLGQIVTLLDTLNCGAALIDRAGRIVHANGRLCEMLQCPQPQVIGASVFDFYDAPQEQDAVRQVLARFDETGEEEMQLPLSHGGRLPVISSARPLGAEPPMCDLRVVTMIDISRQKEAEQRLQNQYEFIVKMSDTVLQQAMELKEYAQNLEARIRQRTRELHDAQMDAIYMLAVASEAKDHDTGRHVRRIQHYSHALAMQMGMSEAEADLIGLSAILHDVGKIHIPDSILTKPGPLTSDERGTMQEHTIAGERILSTAQFFTQARRIARSHHENWDGSGYPDHLSGHEIPIEARIVHVADVYDALTSRRAYKDPWPIEQAADIITTSRGRMFEPAVTDAFTALLESGQLRRIAGAIESDSPQLADSA
jgi:PAS domain S-box-containing protein